MRLDPRHLVLPVDNITMSRGRLRVPMFDPMRDDVFFNGRDLHGWMRLLAIAADEPVSFWQALEGVGVKQVRRDGPPRPRDSL